MNHLRKIWVVFAVFSCQVLMGNPVADFSLSVTQGCVPLSVKFTDKSSGSGLTYLWTFGNGNQSTLKNPSAIYYRSGKFSVTLTVTDANGQRATKTFNPIRVFANPVASFNADTVGCVGQTLSFASTSTPGDTSIVKWSWDFGDGQLGNTEFPGHSYTYSTRFNIGLTVTDGHGCKSLASKSNYIRIKPTPKASFKLDKDYSCRLPGVFNATNTSSGNYTYSWACSDGQKGTGSKFSTNISAYGKYDITLYATGGGCTVQVTRAVNIQKLNANFIVDQGAVCVGAETSFKSTSTPTNTTFNYAWNFGDGAVDSGKSPKHTYISAGKYQIKLNIASGDCRDSSIQTYTVNPIPNASITVKDSIGCKSPFNAEFNITGSDYVSSIWKFGDGSSEKYFSKGTKIQHAYLSKGAYKVNANIINSYGCAQEIEMDEKIQVGLQFIEATPDEYEGCLPADVEYKVNLHLSQPLESITWYFSDSGRSYNGKTLKKHFEKAGDFYAVVYAKTYQGCSLKDSVKISVGRHYIPTFDIKEKDICGTQKVHFENYTNYSLPPGEQLKFAFETVDQFPGDTGSGLGYRDSIMKTDRGGRHVLRLIAKHFGCKTPSLMSDTVYAHGPYLDLMIKSLDCRNTRIQLTPSFSWGNRYELWKDDTIRMPLKQTIQLWDPNKYVLKGWNDTFGCYGEVNPIGPPFFNYQLDVQSKISQECAPAAANFKSMNGLPKRIKWLIDGKDSLIGADVNFTFKEPGKKNIVATAIFDSIDCPDTVKFSLQVKGVRLRSNVISVGKCMPLTLQLVDSNAGTDSDVHTWMVNDSFMEVDQKITNFVLPYLPAGNTNIKIKHIVSGSGGCSTEKEYNIEYNGPVVTYEIRRFTALCDTPVFYFKSFIDTSKTKGPLSFHWQTDKGYESFEQNAGNKFRQMGVHHLTFTVTDSKGCATIYKDSFEVSPNILSPNFKSNPLGRFCPPLECNFTDFSKAFLSEIISWEWDFGDGSTSQLQNPKKLYLLPGTFDITLKVTSKSGCTAVLKKPAYVIVNGPRGSFDFDRGDACLPHTVGFRGTTLDSATMEWDLGDGVVRDGNNFKHTYKRPGRFIPAMILSDTLGCKYTLPPIDTIEVFDYPVADFSTKGLCLKQPILVSNHSQSKHDDPTLKNYWYLNDKPKFIGKDSTFMPDGRGLNHIKLIVENVGECRDTLEKPIKIFAPETDFSVKDKYICLGMPTTFLNSSRSDTNIIEFRWDFGDGNEGKGKDMVHKYAQPGSYTIRMIATDIMHCEDTIVKPGIAIVGDTISPLPIHIRRASVLGDHLNEVVYEAYKDFDFTNYSIYKFSNGRYQKVKEVTNPLDSVYRDPLVNTLDNSYCYKVRMKNLCLLESDLPKTQEHCTIESKSQGQFERNTVRWSPYVGFDTITRYEIWSTESFDRSLYTLLDTVPATQLSYVDTHFNCFISKHYLIKAIQKGGFREYSNSDTSMAIPSTANTTKANLAWRVTVENNENVLLEWKNNAYSRHGIRGYLVEKCFADGSKFNGDLYFDANATNFFDEKVKVNEQSYIYRMRAVDNCNDTTPYSNVSQTILLKGYFDKASNKPALSWNHYREWSQGIARYEIDRMMPDGSFMTIGTVPATVNTYIDKSAESNCTPNYTYRVRAVSNWQMTYDTLAVSVSNYAQVYPESHLFVPNAFSPDLNQINEKFGPNGQYISKYYIVIYNRWGEKLFESYNCMEGWDGTYKNERCQQDVYMYRIQALGADNKTYNLDGTFTLLR